MADGWGGFWRKWRGGAGDPPAEAEPHLDRRPLGCDWVWRPAPWRMPLALPEMSAPASGTQIAPGVVLFHDAATPRLVLHQIPGEGGAPCALCCETDGFDGSFVSLSVELPPAGRDGLSRMHVVRAILPARPGPARLFCRLNLRHGPNVEQLLRALPEGGGAAPFDLAYTRMNEKRLEQVWLDVILEAPRRGAVTLDDLIVLRHPRADI